MSGVPLPLTGGGPTLFVFGFVAILMGCFMFAWARYMYTWIEQRPMAQQLRAAGAMFAILLLAVSVVLLTGAY